MDFQENTFWDLKSKIAKLTKLEKEKAVLNLIT